MNNPSSARSFLRNPSAGQCVAACLGAAVLGCTPPLRADTGPTITSQPQSPQSNVLVCTGWTISVTADGTPPLTYQWQRNGAFLQDATKASLTISNIEFSDSGVYVVRVTNSVNSVWSDPASLFIYPPTTTTQPATDISPNGASLNSATTPKSTNAVVSFNWGTNTSYGNSTAGTDVGNGLAPRNSKQTLSGLNPNTLYHYQAVAASAFGTAMGDDVTFVTANAVAATPTLTLVRDGGSVILTWPANATGFVLQSTTNLVSPAVWSTNLPAPVAVNGRSTVTNPLTGARMFYRLSQ